SARIDVKEPARYPWDSDDAFVLTIVPLSDEPVPLFVEPWGQHLYPILGYEYVLRIENGEKPEIQLEEGPTKVPRHEDRIRPDRPVPFWLSGDPSIRRQGGDPPGLIWSTEYPNEANSLVNDARVPSLLRELRDRRMGGRRVYEREFADLVTPLARSTGHY